MYIKSIRLHNFRNYKTLDLNFDQKTNIFFGDNAQGKTNILEAIYLCSTSRSHRGSKDKEMIYFGEKEAHIRLEIFSSQMNHTLDMHLRKEKAKGAAIDGIPIKRARDLLGLVSVVFFSPEDLNLIKEGPSERRKFLDSEICQLNQVYFSDLSNYHKTIAQRNQLLKDLPYHPSLESTLDIWDEQVIRYGCAVIEARKAFLSQLNEIISDIHLKLSGNKEKIKLTYEPDTSVSEFEARLKKNRFRDEKAKTTTTGPHRDDFSIEANGIDLRRFGSQGQQRTAALSLKLSEISLIQNRTGQSPILLLDDVLSELDRKRQNFLLESLDGIQTMITCTGLDDFVSRHFEISKVFHVVNGIID